MKRWSQMSAWLVSKKHIDALVYARGLNDMRGGRIDDIDNNELGRMLWRENMASMLARYGDAIDEKVLADYHYDPVSAGVLIGREFGPVYFIKAIHCYRYQSCEHDGWESSRSADYCKRLEQMLVHRLPGYDAAPWGID
jgi:hypothetical protein